MLIKNRIENNFEILNTIFRPGGLEDTKDDIKKKCPIVSRARDSDIISSSIDMRLTKFSVSLEALLNKNRLRASKLRKNLIIFL